MAAGEKPQKILYSMGEVSEMFDVKPSLLRFWEGKFDILKPQKNKKGNRLFTPEDIRNLKVIYHLVKERGMTLAGAEKYMKASRRQIERDMELAERLQTIRALLAEVRDSFGTPTAEEITDFGFEPEPETEIATAEEMPEAQVKPEQEKISAATSPTADELMREAIAELEQDDVPEEIPDLEVGTPTAMTEVTEVTEATEAEETPRSEPETAPKQLFVEQTLFDF